MQISWRKFVLEKSSLMHLISQKSGTITSGFKGKKRKYHLLKIRVLLWYALSRAVHKNRTSQVRFSPSKPDLIRPKNACMIVICFLQLLIEPWKPHDRLHGIPGDDQKESRKTPPREGPEVHAERTAHPISTGQNPRQSYRSYLFENFGFICNTSLLLRKNQVVKMTNWFHL